MAAPSARPTFDMIAAKLRKTSHLFEKNGQANISMVRVSASCVSKQEGVPSPRFLATFIEQSLSASIMH